MKIKVTPIEFELSRRTKRLALFLGVPALLIGASAIAFAGVPNTFTDGDTLSADKMNANFAGLNIRMLGAHSFRGW